MCRDDSRHGWQRKRLLRYVRLCGRLQHFVQLRVLEVVLGELAWAFEFLLTSCD